MTYRILMVEDNPSDVELVRTAFEELAIAWEDTVFRDGDAAIEGLIALARNGPLPHLVLLDLNLPRTSGHVVLKHLRSMPPFARVPVVVLSTSNHPADREGCLRDGADDYLVKPPHFTELLRLISLLHDRWLGIRG